MRLRLLLPLAVLSTAAVADELEARRPTVDLGVGFRGFTRTFGNTDGTSTTLGYSGASSGVAAEASYFPGAFATKSLWGDLGLFAEGQLSLGLTTTFSSNHFATSATTVRGGLAVRVPSGRHMLLVHAGVESRAFSVAATSVEGVNRPALPNVGFLGPRAGLGYRVALTSPITLQVKAAFGWALQQGELGSAGYFPSSSTFGLDAQVAVSFAITAGVEVRVIGDWSRAFITLDASHTAADQSFGGGVMLAVGL
jgi:hypothetical protein